MEAQEHQAEFLAKEMMDDGYFCAQFQNQAHYNYANLTEYFMEAFESNSYPNILNENQCYDHHFAYKEENNDKTTNQVIQEPKQLENHEDLFGISPMKIPSFFTPNSPKLSLNERYGSECHRHHQDRAMIEKKIDFNNEDSEIIEKIEEEGSFESEEEGRVGMVRVCKNAKGLRNLSENVYQIVSQLGETTYKEVADRLLDQIGIKLEDYPTQQTYIKDQHNVKRRVYDALNVLIATGVLRKEAKIVLCNFPYKNSHKKKSYRNCKQIKEKYKLDEEFRRAYLSVEKKRESLVSLEHKKKLISSIIKRNQDEKHDDQEKLKFPLISFGIAADPIECSMRQERMELRFGDRFGHFMGDVDMVELINHENIEVNSLLRSVCSRYPLES